MQQIASVAGENDSLGVSLACRYPSTLTGNRFSSQALAFFDVYKRYESSPCRMVVSPARPFTRGGRV